MLRSSLCSVSFITKDKKETCFQVALLITFLVRLSSRQHSRDQVQNPQHQRSSRVRPKITAPPKTASVTGCRLRTLHTSNQPQLQSHNSAQHPCFRHATKHSIITNRNICRLPCLLLERPAKGAYLKPILQDTRLRQSAAL
jgi:mRNA deadenylase 3'-5' endonuclease subunit Ccr4